MSNTSIRVECFRIPTEKFSTNEKLGYLLLKVKGAQTINPTSNDRVSNSYSRFQCIYNRTILFNYLMFIKNQQF